jgi:ABC-type multidrug transport system ATPase subunit
MEPVRLEGPASSAAVPRLALSELEVRYPSFVLGPITLELGAAQIVSLLGPNGSGKTTLIRSVLGLQAAGQGAATWDEVPIATRPRQLLSRIGYLTDSPDDVIPELTPQEYWEFCAMAYSRAGGSMGRMLDRAHALARSLDLLPPSRMIGGFSLGMRRKTQLVAAMLHAPELLILDEPLIGLDFMSIRALELLLERERERGALVWMASHDLGLAARLANRAAVLHLGRLILDVPLVSSADRETLETRVEAAIRLARGAAAS